MLDSYSLYYILATLSIIAFSEYKLPSTHISLNIFIKIRMQPNPHYTDPSAYYYSPNMPRYENTAPPPPNCW